MKHLLIILILTITIRWQAVTTYSNGTPLTSGITAHYQVWRASKPNLNDAKMLADITALNYADTAINPNQSFYYYFVQCYVINSGVKWQSVNSNVVKIKP